MATYTMRLHEYIEQATQNQTGLTMTQKIDEGRKKLFDFDYPIFDEDYRNVFETHFIRNFFMREIGFETEGLFKFQLETWLQINMPYFNQLFESERLEFDPLINTEVDERYTKTNDRNQMDERDTTQSETGNETGNQDRIGNTSETGSKDSSIDNTTDVTDTRDSTIDHSSNTTDTKDSTIDQSSDTTGSSDSTTNQDSNTNTTSNRQTDGTTTDDNFNRKLYADTPDDRLNLTTNDGEGVLEYASNIEENNENNSKTNAETVNTNTDTTSNDSATNMTNTSSGTTGQSVEDTDETSNTVQNTVEDTDETSRTVQNTTEDTDTTNNRDETENVTSSTDRTNDLNRNDKNKSTINDIEDYVYKKRGNIGVQTYSELLNQYRSTFLRIEKEIFKEMNELFMLVY